MVPGEQFPLRAFRRPLAAFGVIAALVWWLANREGAFYVVGVEGQLSSLMGPVLTAMCAGATVALVLALLDASVGFFPALVTAMAVLLLPSFMEVHRSSLHGPPLLALTVFMLAVMVHAPRFSFAYGSVAAFLAVFVSPAAVGLPIAAAGWAALQARRRGRRVWRRTALALAPLVVALAIAPVTGSDVWPGPVAVGWRGGFDAAMGATGHVLGDQLAPGSSGGIRWLIIADAALVIIGVIVMSWRRDVRTSPPERLARRLFDAALIVSAAYAVGMIARTMLDLDAVNPSDPEVLPLVVVMLLVLILATALRWPHWRRWTKVSALLLGVTWAFAAFMFR